MKIKKFNENEEESKGIEIPEDLKAMFKQYLQDNLSINTETKGGDYGSSRYIEVTLFLGKDILSQSDAYLG